MKACSVQRKRYIANAGLIPPVDDVQISQRACAGIERCRRRRAPRLPVINTVASSKAALIDRHFGACCACACASSSVGASLQQQPNGASSSSSTAAAAASTLCSPIFDWVPDTACRRHPAIAGARADYVAREAKRQAPIAINRRSHVRRCAAGMRLHVPTTASTTTRRRRRRAHCVHGCCCCHHCVVGRRRVAGFIYAAARRCVVVDGACLCAVCVVLAWWLAAHDDRQLPMRGYRAKVA